MKIGVLSLQGDIIEHINQIQKLGHEPIKVKKEEDLNYIDAIILPGGESTTIGRLLNITGLMEPLRNKILNGLPVWGTCAGMILLAKDIENDQRKHLGIMDIKVKRNAFGTQIDSFKTYETIDEVGKDKIELVFIRAPYVVEVDKDVQVLCKVKDKIVAVKQKNMLASSFHPELTDDVRFLNYFIENFVKSNPYN
ncbi:pyridoxal 5'-phosphate synthase glutaminase subunit PdxT [uncultured Clostridium sp.]|uniref:pyridoxal 5'-phosphate synthase glutaminase subunit PdxT n=1 Tax=uncultured Clostridium sp. TaxID=59620 RepID=UPI0025F1F78B|nr:pyridoxal 5'-phosphate synthase glutaminase subunit PdxT [uncultured Clostridium sp.]